MDEQRIKEAAYALWEEAGRPEGRDLEHWFKASSMVEGDVSGPGGGNDGQPSSAVDADDAASGETAGS